LNYRADYTGWYCTFDERFWTEKDVVDGLCPDCKRPVERLSESNYFFKMSQYQNRLVKHIEAHPDFIRPRSRSNEVLGFLQKPLEDLSISRPTSRLAWGIPLPFDSNYVTYVWFDALVNYISALEYLRPTPSLDRYGQDGDFSREALIGRINTDLANDLGNLLNRSLTMIERFARGIVPEPEKTVNADLDKQLQRTALEVLPAVERHLGSLEFNRALEAIWSLVQLGNQYIDKSAPWTLAKQLEDKPRLNTVLYNAAETLRFLCLALYPF